MKDLRLIPSLTKHAWKSICQQFWLLAVLSMLFFLLCTAAGPVAGELLDQGVDFTGPTFGVCAPEGDSTAQLLETLTARMKDVSQYATFRSMSPEAARILKNPGLIAINQDPGCRQPFSIGGSFNYAYGDQEDSFVWAKLLDGGDLAIGMFNLSDSPRNLYFTLNDLALPRFCGRKLVMTDVWSGETVETVDQRHIVKVDGCDCRVYRAKILPV